MWIYDNLCKFIPSYHIYYRLLFSSTENTIQVAGKMENEIKNLNMKEKWCLNWEISVLFLPISNGN